MLKCTFCERWFKNPGGKAVHQKHCESNPNYVPFVRSPNAGRQKGCVAWNKGKSTPSSIRIKISRSLTGNSTGVAASTEKEEARKEKIRKSILIRYSEGWMPRAGRCKKIKYSSRFAGEVTLDGTWELAVAEFLDILELNWQRNTKRFKYTNEHGNSAHYTPDFYVEDHDMYIEVKGYETKKDRCKWSDFPCNLTVWKKREIQFIQKWKGG